MTPPTPDDDVPLRGVHAIAEHIKQTHRQTSYLLEHGRLPGFKIGEAWFMRPSTYRALVEKLEAEAMAAHAP